MVAQTRHTGQPSPKKLAFREKLITKGQSNDTLLKKLKTLHSELAEMDQELVDVNSMSSVRKELVSSSIMLHKDRGVKAYAACCMADILRLYAPDAPYTQAELRDIFQFFFKQLSNNLKGPDVTYYTQYFHLLESLSTVKSVVLVCDLPNADELVLGIFRDLFAMIRRDLPKQIETFIAEILVAIVDESSSLSGDVLEIIMAQFMDKSARVEQPAYRLAVSVCNQTADKLQRNVALYFTDIIVSNSEEEDFEQIRIAHDLIKRLHASCPNLLPSVIPQLEEELHADASTLRAIATQVLGEMFSDKSGGDLARNHPSTWNAWLGRKVDKSPAVRLKFVESSNGLYSAPPEMAEAIESALNGKLLDPDEKIRAAVCKIYSQLDYETAVHHVSELQLKAIAGRVADKKLTVRFEAANSLAKLYGLAYPEIENNNVTAISKFSWIPNELLHMTTIVVDCRTVVEQVLSDYILPLPSFTPSSLNSKTAEVDETAWTDHLLNVMRYLTDQSITALVLLSNLKPNRPSAIDIFVDACVQYNGGVIDENEERVTQKLGRIIEVISVYFPDPAKMREDLKAFAKVNEPRLYKLMKTCLDVETDLKGLVKAQHDFIRRLEQSSSTLTPSLTALLRRGSLHIVNTSSIPTLLLRLQRSQGTTITKTNLAANHAQVLFTNVAKFCPALLKPHVDELITAIEDGKNDKTVAVGLQALASLVKLDPLLMPLESSSTVEVIKSHVLGSNHRHAKFAARIFAFCEEKNTVCGGVVESIADSLNKAPADQLVAHLVSLAQFARFIPDAFEQKSDIITAFLLKKLLMVPSLPPDDLEDDGEEWAEDDEVSNNLKAKIAALKILRYRTLTHANSKNAVDISTPVLKMLATILDRGGSLAGNDAVEEDRKALSRIRLQAAISLLYLSTVPAYADALAPKFVRLALTIQDTCFNVRMSFLQKLVPLLWHRKLPAKYHLILFLTAHDPEEDIKQKAAAAASGLFKKLPSDLRTENLEFVFIRLLHLLAHHPDFATSQSELQDIAKYVQFYLELIGSEETIPLLYHLASKGKTVRDPESQAYSENLYAMCEIAQELIKFRAQHNNWTIPTFPGKIKLPHDILRPQPNAEIANKIAKQTFLPPDASSWLAEIVVAAPREKKERKIPAKRKAATTNGHSKRSRKRRKQTDSSDEESFDVHTDATDIEMSDGPPVHPPDVDEAEESSGEEQLGRGARSKAKAKAKRKSRTSKKAGTPSSDG
ncbi:armadillo-type protein [Lentinula edodes]|uniref:Armadillo-type protein n=1 Tax=Lentinula lateritia TaxID=40482 RepID=A0A9W9DDI7_9AGAR|nr:armadillo-type protein [Lentinula edodes]